MPTSWRLIANPTAAEVVFECSLDRESFRECQSPVRATVAVGMHTFRVQIKSKEFDPLLRTSFTWDVLTPRQGLRRLIIDPLQDFLTNTQPGTDAAKQVRKVLKEVEKAERELGRLPPAHQDALAHIEKAAEELPDLILLDTNMPVMNGHEMLRELRAKPETAHIPVIMLTAQYGTQDIAAASAYDIADYITKPFDFAELIEKVESALGGA